ncbi:Glycosyltransferase involved in cell wall bisynthesis [Methylorubrum salsuginis]|uniref:Glycosyltransferase involved in cell wall bisynthesis n=2 Tax=Methylorubrum salsuginis TaxID=414703 RepID=A0A1I4LRS9_9HYPH|nr:Glycosyltransferase involved in cell wall bisynthesis [Methylorubrum salsuginis]
MTSTTFIRREIEALEQRGLEIRRFAIRAWPVALVDLRDVAEQGRTEYLLTGNLAGLVGAFLREAADNPGGLLRSLPTWLRLARDTGGLVRPMAYLMQAALLRRRAAKEGIDHIHVHFATNATAVAMLARLMGGPGYSFTAHGPDEFADSATLSVAPKIARARFVVAISDYCRDRLAGLAGPGDAAKIHLARCGLALEEFPDGDPETDALAAASQTFVCVGRFCPVKGQVLIPQAVAALAPRFPRLRVVLVGDGESRPAIEAAIRAHDVSDRVILHGWAPNAEVLALIRTSRALLLPSEAEGLPVVIMEALALRRPVITTRIAGIPELVDDSCGWLISPGDGVALTGALAAALDCPPAEWAAKGAAGRERVECLHDRRSLARALNRLFAEAGRSEAPATVREGKAGIAAGSA